MVKQYDTYISALYKRYRPESLVWQDDFDDIVKEAGYDTNPSLIKAIKRIQSMDTTRPLLDSDQSLSNADLLMLIWHALKDEDTAHFVAGEAFSEAERKQSKRQLLVNLLQAQNEYALNSPACFMGTRHHIIRTLDKIHIDCFTTYEAFTKEHVEELYNEVCANAISELSNSDREQYEAYFHSLFSDEDVAVEWIQSTKEHFWACVEERQEQTTSSEQLPLEELNRLKEAYFTQWLKNASENVRDFSRAFAVEHGQWQQFPLLEPLVFSNQDFRGMDLSTLDLSRVTFINCDLRLTGILANPSFEPARLIDSRLEEDSLWIAAQNGYVLVIRHYLSQQANALDALNSKGDTLFTFAALWGQVEVVKAILAIKPPLEVINATDGRGNKASYYRYNDTKWLINLCAALSGLEQHAKILGGSHAENILPLVSHLKQITLDFYTPNANAAELKEAFTKTYQALIPHTKTHREPWKPLLANILIAASIVGLLAIGINYAINREFGFFTKTKRELLLDDVANTATPELYPAMAG